MLLSQGGKTSNTASLSAIGAHLRNERYYRLPILMACAWGRCRTRRFSTLQIWLLDTFPASQSVITLNLFLPRIEIAIRRALRKQALCGACIPLASTFALARRAPPRAKISCRDYSEVGRLWRVWLDGDLGVGDRRIHCDLRAGV